MTPDQRSMALHKEILEAALRAIEWHRDNNASDKECLASVMTALDFSVRDVVSTMAVSFFPDRAHIMAKGMLAKMQDDQRNDLFATVDRLIRPHLAPEPAAEPEIEPGTPNPDSPWAP